MPRKQLILFGSIFAVVLALLLALYALFLQPSYVVLVDEIRSEDAAAIVAELEAKDIPYALEDDGNRIMVPENQVGEARLAIAGTQLMAGGTVGFELFNQSDMGLTEFAQKVNYQRALQGELARTIMMMDGIAFARVHLSLPEHTLFRGDSEAAKAAVTVQPERGRTIGADRVTGIQELVAAAVEDLAPRDVAVLNARGQLVSPETIADEPQAAPTDERSALEAYYRARAINAAEPFLQEQNFVVRVSAVDVGGAAAQDTMADAKGRNFSLRVALRTEAELPGDERADIERAVGNAVGIDPARGDAIRFETGPLENVAPAPLPHAEQVVDTPVPPAGQASGTEWISQPGDWLWSRWFWLALLAIIAVVVPLRRRTRRMSEEERASFAQLLGEQIEARQDRARV